MLLTEKTACFWRVHAFSDNRQPVSLFTETGFFVLKEGKKRQTGRKAGVPSHWGTCELEKVVIRSTQETGNHPR
jgi:hypothetical protein